MYCYYACADNDNLNSIESENHIYPYKFALTFASKKKLRTVKKGFHKYGYNLEVEELVKGENQVVARFEDKDLRGIKPGFRLDRAD